MRGILLGLSILSLAACSSPEYARRMPPSPAPAMPLAPTTPPRPAPPAVAPSTDEAATRAWLDEEIERHRYVPPPPPVEQREPVADAGRPAQVEPDPGYPPYYHYGPRYDSPPSRGTTFPLNTAVGAGIGAIIGHQSGHRGQGAWIGGSLGLLMDLSSHW